MTSPPQGTETQTEPTDETQPTDVFVRAVNENGTIQLGMADPELAYGERPVEVVRVTRARAFALIGELAQALSQTTAWTGKPIDENFIVEIVQGEDVYRRVVANGPALLGLKELAARKGFEVTGQTPDSLEGARGFLEQAADVEAS